jgi:hypothetical protein
MEAAAASSKKMNDRGVMISAKANQVEPLAYVCGLLGYFLALES